MPRGKSSHEAPDGRTFTVGEARCSHSDCWVAWCGCGERLTAHDFDEDGAVAGAIAVLASDDPRPGFGHARCRG